VILTCLCQLDCIFKLCSLEIIRGIVYPRLRYVCEFGSSHLDIDVECEGASVQYSAGPDRDTKGRTLGLKRGLASCGSGPVPRGMIYWIVLQKHTIRGLTE